MVDLEFHDGPERGDVDGAIAAEEKEDVCLKTGNRVCIVTFTNTDIPFIVNGLETDPIELRPFSYFFTEQKIWRSWCNIGWIPFTRKCLSHPKVRHELGKGGASEKQRSLLEALESDYQKGALECQSLGFNNKVFDCQLPV